MLNHFVHDCVTVAGQNFILKNCVCFLLLEECLLYMHVYVLYVWLSLLKDMSPAPCKTFKITLVYKRASLIDQLGKNPPEMQETPVQFLDWDDPL